MPLYVELSLAARRVSTRAIGRVLGRSLYALHLKASRLGLTLRSARGLISSP